MSSGGPPHPSFHSVTAGDGVPLFVRVHEPLRDAGLPAQGTLLIVHGAGEHGGCYDQAGAWFAARGWRVLVPDLRGHGRSGGVRSHTRQFEDYLRDLDTLRAWAQPAGPACSAPQPLQSLVPCRSSSPESLCRSERMVLIGHSMGGLAVLRYLQTRGPCVQAAVLSCPLLELVFPVPRWKYWLGRVVRHLLPQARFRTQIKAEQLSGSATTQQRRRSDPLRLRTVTAGWFFNVLDALDQARQEASPSLPILLLQGGADAIVHPDGPLRWWSTLSRLSPKSTPWHRQPAAGPVPEKLLATARTLYWWPGRYHELFGEDDWTSVAESVQNWLDRQVPVVNAAIAPSPE